MNERKRNRYKDVSTQHAGQNQYPKTANSPSICAHAQIFGNYNKLKLR
jgi:hypothetical protein